MNLHEFAPDAVVVELNGKQHIIEYTFLSEKELVILYGSEEAYIEAYKGIAQNLAEMKSSNRDDLVKYLYAGLINTDIWPDGFIVERNGVRQIMNRDGCLAFIQNQLRMRDAWKYAMVIVASMSNCRLTPEMLEMIEVMSYDDEGKKKVPAAPGQNGSQDTPILSRLAACLKLISGRSRSGGFTQ